MIDKLKPYKITDFFNSEYVNWASYDTIRKIGSVVDGQKNASRKALWYTLQKNLKNELKVSQMDSKASEFTEYLHGSMVNVIVNLAQNYTGTNNINLLYPEGNFGTRLVPEPSAPRYIYTYGTKECFEMFNKEDTEILDQQTFEGQKIEPKFLLPKLPLILINGSIGPATGYAQKILPRNPKEIEKYINYYLTHPDAPKKPFKNKPWYKGFKGNIRQGDNLKNWIIEGAFEVKGNIVTITELPIGYSLKSYKKVLNALENQKKIISYKDYSEEEFHFEVKMPRDVMKTMYKNKLITYLKLYKKVTENYTVMNEYNKIEVFDSISEIMDRYIEVKLKYLQKRKEYLIQKITSDIKLDISRYFFVKNIVDDKLIINKRKTQDIILDLEKIPKIIKKDDSYDYLLGMTIGALTVEKMQHLMNKIKIQKEELDFVKSSTLQEMWIKDLE